MDVGDALRILGLETSPSWESVRAAHRAAIRTAHPDAGGDAASAARVNEAYDVLRRITDGGDRPVPSPAPTPPSAPRSDAREPRRRVVGADDPMDVLMRLADAAHDIGDVVFVDPNAGILEVVVGDAPAVGQLAVTVSEPTADTDGVPVAFTLEPLGVTPAPSIHDVVANLMGRLRHRRRG